MQTSLAFAQEQKLTLDETYFASCSSDDIFLSRSNSGQTVRLRETMQLFLSNPLSFNSIKQEELEDMFTEHVNTNSQAREEIEAIAAKKGYSLQELINEDAKIIAGNSTYLACRQSEALWGRVNHGGCTIGENEPVNFGAVLSFCGTPRGIAVPWVPDGID